MDSKRDCIYLVPFLNRPTAETAFLDSALKSGVVTKVCVVRPNNVFYTQSDCNDKNKKLYCCVANPEYPSMSTGKAICSFKRSIVDLINLSHDRHVRVGVLCSDSFLHIWCSDSRGQSQWERHSSINLEIDVNADSKSIAYSRTYNMIFWPKQVGDRCYIFFYDLLRKGKERILFSNVQPCSLQVKMSSLIFLYANQGVLFIPFERIFPMNEQTAQSYSMMNHRSVRYNESSQKRIVYGEYWNPDSTSMEHVKVEDFKAKTCKSRLQGHCLSHDRTVLYVLYGSTVYALTAISCTPLTKIEIPDGLGPFQFMFLGKITVLQGAHRTAAFLKSLKPVKTMERRLESAGFGYVWDTSGIYQIRMCNPQECSEEIQREMVPTHAYFTANGIGRAMIGHQDVMMNNSDLMARHYQRRVPFV